ncbi:MAG: NAD-dependent succinate-semialdehyde dehydrogenase [Mycobacterium sp.]
MTTTATPHLPTATRRRSEVLADVQPLLHIDGEWIQASNAATFEVDDPSTGTVLRTIADASPADGLQALAAASKTQASWSQRPARERGEILRRAYELLTERRANLALLISLESGKPMAEALAEVAYGAEFFRWYAEEAVRIRGQMGDSPDGNGRVWTLHQPVGPCLLITPWNFPLAMATRKIGPAIAAGCTMVVKPAEQTPLTTLALVDILIEAGTPPGVVNVVTTTQAGAVVEPLIRDGRIRKVSFTGSTAVGRRLITLGAEHVVRMSMELGGNAPLVIFDDADLDAAVDEAVKAKTRNAGQACIAANRIYVQRAVSEEFTERFTAAMARLRVGRGTDEGVDVGPLIDDQAVTKVENLVEGAVAHGARCLLGGSRIPGVGHFFAPTVLVDVPATARIHSEEIFGPVAPLTFFDTERQAVELANATEYGLASYIFTTNAQRGWRLTEQLQTGMVGLNKTTISNPAAPFGGTKHSGFGREGGSAGIHEYLETKYVASPD